VRLTRSMLAAVAIVMLAACSFESKNEQLAHRITSAVMADDMSGVQALFTPDTKITRIEVVEYSGELNGQGKLHSIVETHPCDPGWHCFNAVFANRIYREHMRLNAKGQITDWFFHVATTPTPSPDPT